MKKEIDVENNSLMKLFSENNFTIPSYQRQYVWNEENTKELLQDIFEASVENNGENEYFLGSLVCQRVEDSLEVLDGQQRLTTLYLIFHVMRNLFLRNEDNSYYIALDELLHQKENKAKKLKEKNKFNYEIRKDVKDLFDKLATHNDISEIVSFNDFKIKSNISIENIINNLNEVQKYFSNQDMNIVKYYDYLIEQVKIITITTEDLDNAFRIFSVLNNRGIQLQNADLIKADNIGAIEESKKIDYSLKWEDIENYFDGDLDRFLSIVRLILLKEKAKLNLYSEYKNYFDKNHNLKGKDFIDKLDKYKEIYEKVLKLTDSTISNKTRNLLTIMYYLPHNDWISVVISYFYKFGNNKFDKFIELFDYMVSTDNIIGYDITTKIKNISLVLTEIDNAKTPEELISKKESILYDIDIEKLTYAIKQDIYRKRVSKYILLKIEYLSRSNDDVQVGNFQKLSIEHVYPQKPKDVKDWDFENEIKLDKYRNKVGNLVLLNISKNSSLSNSSFKNKNTKYNSNNSIDIFEETKKVYNPNRNEWKLEDIKRRQNAVIKWLIENKKVEDWV